MIQLAVLYITNPLLVLVLAADTPDAPRHVPQPSSDFGRSHGREFQVGQIQADDSHHRQHRDLLGFPGPSLKLDTNSV